MVASPSKRSHGAMAEERSITVWECKCSTGWTDFGVCPDCGRKAREVRYVPRAALATAEAERDDMEDRKNAQQDRAKAAEAQVEAVRGECEQWQRTSEDYRAKGDEKTANVYLNFAEAILSLLTTESREDTG
jgi:hypothetical protein